MAISQRGSVTCVTESFVHADDTDDRVRLPTDASRLVKGVDVLPWVLAPLMGPEEYDIEVSLSQVSACLIV